jgi:hypothetical protein
MTKYKPDEVSISINGVDIKGAEKPHYESGSIFKGYNAHLFPFSFKNIGEMIKAIENMKWAGYPKGENNAKKVLILRLAGMTLRQTADKVGLKSCEQIRRIESKALYSIKKERNHNSLHS